MGFHKAEQKGNGGADGGGVGVMEGGGTEEKRTE